MAVNHVSVFHVKPGSLGEVVKLMATAKPTLERVGGRARAWQLMTFGVAVGRVSFVMRFDDYAAWGSWSKKIAVDQAWMKQAHAIAVSDLATLESQSLVAELPGMEAAPLTGKGGPRVRTMRRWEVDKGRHADALALLGELKTQVERLGGGFSAAQATFAGPASGEIRVGSEFADMEAFGKFQQKSVTDPEFSAFVRTRVLSAGSPVTLVSAGLLSEIVM